MKKRVLYFIIVLALVLCMALPMATPVMASQISGTKHTIPALPNMYRVGDTIYYEMTVSNPGNNTVTTTLTNIWDTLPDGSIHWFVQEGVNPPLVQTPGQNATFYLNYVVDWADAEYRESLGYWIVSNIFEAEGYDSNGDGVTVRVNKNSRIIDPDIDIEKYVWDGAGWQDADTTTGPYLPSTQDPVVFKFEIDNTGDVELTSVNLTDTDMLAFYTDQACTNLASFPTTLAVNETKTYYGKLPWAQGQHSNNATATGTPPVGDPVSDSDLAHYFGSGASIDVEKHVWDGATWYDADLPTGPSLTSAQNPVVFRFVITNNDNVSLANVTLTDTDMLAFYTNQACTNPASFPTTLAVSETKTYYGKLPWAQGQHSNNATATGTPPVGAPISDSDPAHYFGSGIGIDIEKYTNGEDADAPTGPHIVVGGSVTWTYNITNTGEVDLTGIVVTDDHLGVTPVYVSGDDGDGVLNITETWTYEAAGVAVAGQYANIGTVVGYYGLVQVTDSDPSHYLGLGPDIDIEKHTNGVDADAAPGVYISINSTVTWTYIVTNTGALNLTGIVVTDDHLGVTPVYVGGDDGDGVLNPGEIWTYQAISIAEAGQYANVGTVTGTPPVGADVSDSDPSHYYNRVPVGWETYPVNKVRVLLPWIALLTAIIVGASLLVLRHRRAQS